MDPLLLPFPVGINLTAASHVFLLEPCLNPALEEQAVGRAWRMGQTRPVAVKRLCVKVCGELQWNSVNIALSVHVKSTLINIAPDMYTPPPLSLVLLFGAAPFLFSSLFRSLVCVCVCVCVCVTESLTVTYLTDLTCSFCVFPLPSVRAPSRSPSWSW